MNRNQARIIFHLLILVLLIFFASQAIAEEKPVEQIRVATWNIEHFMKMFDQQRMPYRSRNKTELFRDEEDLHEIAATLKLDNFRPDVLVIQECCSQKMLEHFNRRWLDGEYGIVKVFKGNVEGQWLGMLAREGFGMLEVREYYREKDPVRDPAVMGSKKHARLDEKNLLFSRGPAFVKLKTPTGNKLWVGVTHVKSKYGNSEAVTRWRIRELQRTREICEELISESNAQNLILLGDFNDTFGKDRVERSVGTDALSVMLEGSGDASLHCVTRKLSQQKDIATYHCRIKPPRYRAFIDHAFVSKSLKPKVQALRVIDAPIAVVASDHLPVMVTLGF